MANDNRRAAQDLGLIPAEPTREVCLQCEANARWNETAGYHKLAQECREYCRRGHKFAQPLAKPTEAAGGAQRYELSITIEGTEQVATVMELLRKAGFQTVKSIYSTPLTAAPKEQAGTFDARLYARKFGNNRIGDHYWTEKAEIELRDLLVQTYAAGQAASGGQPIVQRIVDHPNDCNCACYFRGALDERKAAPATAQLEKKNE